MLLDVVFPIEPFNTAVRNGTVGETMGKILESIKPESVYFTEHDGHRGAVLIVNLDNPSQIPALAEPFFLKFNAECRIRIAMSVEDLKRGGLAELGKKWD